MMAVGIGSMGSADYFRTPRRGFIQDGKFVQYPKEHHGSYRGESDAEYQNRLKLFDAGVQRVGDIELAKPEDPEAIANRERVTRNLQGRA